MGNPGDPVINGGRSASGGLTPSTQRAIDRCALAASQATSTFAHADAAEHLDAAVRLLIDAGEAGTPTHFELLHSLGKARWRAGQREEATAVFDEAWQIAQLLGDVDRAARAALGGGFSCDFGGEAAATRAARCRRALDHLPHADGATRVRLMADLAASLAAQTDPQPARRAAAEALAMARVVGDPVALGYALVAVQFTNQSPTRLEGRIADAREILSIAASSGEHPLQVLGRFCLMGALLEAADPALHREADAQAETVRRLEEPGYRRHDVWFQCMRALLRGDVDEGERLAALGLEVGVAAGDPDALAVHGAQTSVARWIRGQTADSIPTYEAMRSYQPDHPMWTSVLAATHARTGRPELARPLLDEFELDDVPDDQYALLTLTTAADAACITHDARLIRPLYEALVPYAGRIAPVAMGVVCWGPVDRPLGLLAFERNDVEAGLDHLGRALAATERLGARPWIAEAALDMVHAQLQHGRVCPGTDELLGVGESLATSIGMPVLTARAAELRQRLA